MIPYRFRNSMLAMSLFTQISSIAYAQAGINLNGGAVTNVAPAVNPTDAVIKQQLDDESAARIAGDLAERNARTNVVNQFTTLLSAEAEARAAADTQLASSIAAYVQDGQQSQARFDAEAIARTAAIAAESEARTAAVSAESNARIAGDEVLDVRISSESVARIVADDALDLRINREASARMAADASEAASRLTADTALGVRIDNETRERMFADRAIRNEIASSTATAIALGGAVVLPDVNFTLSGNVATYKGAQAIAVNGAARLAHNTYVTSAVGGGLNKRGAVGARVGVVLGF